MKNLLVLLAVLLFAVAAYYIYDTLRERTYPEQLGEIIYFEDQRVLSPELTKYLESDNADLRARAALAIGRIGAPGCGQLLYDLITSDSSMDVAALAGFAIGLTGEKKFAADLLDLALDLPSKVTVRLVEAAGRLTDTTMTAETDAIADFLFHPSPEVRSAACMALFRAGALSKGPQLTQFVMAEPDEEVQIAALYALARSGVVDAQPVYEKYIADADPYVRTLAVRGIGRSDSAEAVHYLTIALNDSDPRVVVQAIGELSNKKTPEAMSKLVKKLGTVTDEKLKVETIQALTGQENPGAVDIVNAILSAQPSVNVTVAAIGYLATIQKDRAVMLIDSLQTVDNQQIRAACADAYVAIGTEGIVSRLAVLFNDNSPLVRMTAFYGLVGLDSGNVDFYLGKALEDSVYVMPIVAIDEIKTRRLASYLPKLKSLVEAGPRTNKDIRAAIVDCSEAFIGDSIATVDTLARQILIAGILDTDYIIRRTAAGIYKDKLNEDRYKQVPPANTRLSKSKIIGAVEKYVSNPYATIITNRGEIDLELYFDIAPLTVINFIDLAKDEYYNGIIFHRVIPNFVAQAGDPEGTGWGGPGYEIRCEYSSETYRRGTVGIATSGKDTGGSQFFITHTPLPHLDGRYTVMGQVLSGMDVVDQIVRGDTIKEVLIHEGAYQ